MKEKFYWRGMNQDVANYIDTCDVCSRNKKHTPYGRRPLIEYHAGDPMERVHIDFLGPLPQTPRGNEHILMMVDQFTKWVECIPLPSQKVEDLLREVHVSYSPRALGGNGGGCSGAGCTVTHKVIHCAGRFSSRPHPMEGAGYIAGPCRATVQVHVSGPV